MNYGYILQEQKSAQKFSAFRRLKIKQKEMYKTPENMLNFFYLPCTKNKHHEEKAIKKLIECLKQEKTEYIAFEPDLSKHASFLKEQNFFVIDGSAITKHLLVQAFFSYLKTNKTDITKIGVHLCANNMNDISFFFDKISKINTTFTMCTENEMFYDSILKKYGIAVHFSDNVFNKIIIYYNGKIPYSTNSHLIDLPLGNYKISGTNFPDLFQNITPAEAELLIRMNYSSCDTGFYDSGIKIAFL